MQHLLDIHPLTRKDVESLVQKALAFKQGLALPQYPTHAMAMLFYENSTRTRVSFELAAKRLQLPVVSLELAQSSEKKGETVADTVSNLVAMGIDLLVVRHCESGLPQALAQQTKAHIINAGDGIGSHPSQALLDVMTIREHHKDLSPLKIAIVGDIRHSRVANSLQAIFALMGVQDLRLVAPKLWQPETVIHGSITDSLSEGLEEADIVICLRVQHERLLKDDLMNMTEYKEQFSVTYDRLKIAHPQVKIMHPGPINRGVELEDGLVNSDKSLILQQVTNGVFMRMAIVDALLGGV